MYPDRVVSGMRPAGRLHLGHQYGVLRQWIKLQAEQPCLFFVADWHALVMQIDDPQVVEKQSWDMVLDWLAAGIDPAQATLFIQSRVPEHAELHLLLSMATPLHWLEQSASFQIQCASLSSQERSYGMLGSALLQAADILLYRASTVPVGELYASGIDITCEIARRFNHLYGKEKDFDEKAQNAIKKLGSKRARLYSQLRAEFQQEGKDDALDQAKAMLDEAQNLSMIDRERLFGYLEGSRKLILVEPQALLLAPSQMPGLDGKPMRCAGGNAIALREEKPALMAKIARMPHDPARRSDHDAGNPAHCPVWALHQLLSTPEASERINLACRNAELSCADCKRALGAEIAVQQEVMHERAQPYLDDPSLLRAIIADGCDRARKLAQETMRDVREAIGLSYGP